MTGATLVELVNGEIVTRDAEAWRAECLARHVLQLPSKAARVEWLTEYEKRHGAEATKALRETMTRVWIKGREGV